MRFFASCLWFSAPPPRHFIHMTCRKEAHLSFSLLACAQLPMDREMVAKRPRSSDGDWRFGFFESASAIGLGRQKSYQLPRIERCAP
jgi:hypothetical protein